MDNAPTNNDLMHNYEDLTDLKTVGDVFDEVRKLRKAINEHRTAMQNQLRRFEDSRLYAYLPEALPKRVDHEIVGEGL